MTERNARLELVTLLFVRGGTAKAPPTKATGLKAIVPLLRRLGDAESKRRIEAAFDACIGAGELEERKLSARHKSSQLSLSLSGEQRLGEEFGKLHIRRLSRRGPQGRRRGMTFTLGL